MLKRRSFGLLAFLVAAGTVGLLPRSSRGAASLAPHFKAGPYLDENPGGAVENGDVATSILNDVSVHWIEVPAAPKVPPEYKPDNLTLRIYDPAFGVQFREPVADGYDIEEAAGGSFDSCITYTLYDPDGDPVEMLDSGSRPFSDFAFNYDPANKDTCTWIADRGRNYTSVLEDRPDCRGGNGGACCDLLAGSAAYIQWVVDKPEPGHYWLEVDTIQCGLKCTDCKGNDIAGYKLHAFNAKDDTEYNIHSELVTVAAASYAQNSALKETEYRYYPYVEGGDSFYAKMYNVTGASLIFELTSTTWRWDPDQNDPGPVDVTPLTPVPRGKSGYTFYTTVSRFRYPDPPYEVSSAPDQGIWTLGQVPYFGNKEAVYTSKNGDTAPSIATIWFEPETSAVWGEDPSQEVPIPAFRMYLPQSDSFPKKPFLVQYLTHAGGPNPPRPGDRANYIVDVLFYTPFGTNGPVHFDRAKGFDIEIYVPDGGGMGTLTYQGLADITIGDFSDPDGQRTPGVWDPGTVDPKIDPTGCSPNPPYEPCGPEYQQFDRLAYKLEFTRTETGGVLLTGNPGNTNAPGTRAIWRDETSKPGSDGIEPMLITNTRGTSDSGETSGTGTSDSSDGTPTRASVFGVDALSSPDSGMVSWSTASEVGTVAFRVHRVDPWTGDAKPVSAGWVPAYPERAAGGDYSLVDPALADAAGTTVAYVIDEIDINHRVERHGPFTVRVGSQDRLPSLGRSGWTSVDRELPAIARAPTTRGPSLAWLATSVTPEFALIHVTKPGLVRLSAGDVANALGLTTLEAQESIAAAALSLTRGGEPVSYLADADGMLFYGTGSSDLYSTTGIYRLERDAGRLMEVDDRAAPSAPGSAPSFESGVYVEEDHRAAPSVASPTGNSYWMWTYLLAGVAGADRASFDLPIQQLASSGEPARLSVHLQGGSVADGFDNHHVLVRVNGSLVADELFSGKASHTVEASVPAGLLSEGSNTVEVEAMLDAGVPYGVVYVDGVGVHYQRTYVATDDAILVRGSGDPTITVSGFSGLDALVFDLSTRSRPRLLGNVLRGTDATGSTVSFTAGNGNGRYLVATRETATAPSAVISVPPSGLKDASNRADYLVIAASHLVRAAQRLADRRAEQGLTSKVIDINDIYNHYADGAPDPRALSNFLRAAYRTWATPPRYVVLVGDGSYDHRDVMGRGDNLISPRMLRTADGLFAADSILGDFDLGDGTPEVIIGRVPVVTVEELEAYIDKVEAFEDGRDGSWARRALVAADNRDTGGDFSAEARSIDSAIASELDVDLISLDDMTLDDARLALLSGLSAGARFLHFTGHGGMDRLAAEGLLTVDDLEGLDNAQMPPVVVTASCLLGRFALPGMRGLSERLVTDPNRGAVAVIGSAGLEYNSDSSVITAGIMESIAIAKTRRLGDAFAYGLAESVNRRVPRDSRQLFNLLGDPALMLYPESVDEQAAPLPAQGCDCRGAGGPAGLLSLAAFCLLLGRRRRSTSNRGRGAGSDLS